MESERIMEKVGLPRKLMIISFQNICFQRLRDREDIKRKKGGRGKGERKREKEEKEGGQNGRKRRRGKGKGK